jgi:long-chain acyl-CoA synthetase
MEWTLAEQGCYSQNGTTVPLYDTLGVDSVSFVVKQTDCSSVLCTEAEVKNMIEAKDQCPTLKTLIICGGAISEVLKKECESKGLTIYTFEEVEAAGEKDPQPLNPPAPESVCTFCYTSGTTGDPKGAMLTHKNMIADLYGAHISNIRFYPEDVHLSYLPLAHVFERIVLAAALYAGAKVGYYQGNTLKLLEDLGALRPTVFPSVPRLLNKIYDKITGGAQAAGGVKTALFNKALQTKLANLHAGHGVHHALWDKLVFGGVASKVGLDRCRLMITGSAPIAAHVFDFLRVAFSTIVIEGYGQTETCAAATASDGATDFSSGHVGGPVACNEIRLESVSDMGYNCNDTMHGVEFDADKKPVAGTGIPCMGRGEVCFRGNNIFKGYYKMADKTAETIDSDGWCHSGDIGIWLPNGQLKLVDRKKNIFKLAQGEYVAAEKIENIYAQSKYVAQSFVYGDSLQSVLVGIIVPDAEAVKAWAAETNTPGTHAELCASEALKKVIMSDLKKIGTAAKLNSFEMIKSVHLSPFEFSVENDMLTPTFKLKRNEAKIAFKTQIDTMYSAFAITEDGKK